jgi:succinoglycan biosynthesis transport protein ExoP
VNSPSLEPAATGLPQPVETVVSPTAIWRAFRKNWLLVTGVAAAISLVVAFYTLGQAKIYEAKATLLFDPQPPRPLGHKVDGAGDPVDSYWSNKEYYLTQQWVIQSLRITSEVVRTLGLNKDAAFLDDVPSGTAAAPREVSIEAAAAVLQKRLSVELVRDSRLAVIKYQDTDPARTQKIVAALSDTYVQKNLDDATQSNFSAADWLHSQMGSLKAQLESSEMQLHEYKKDKNILSLSMNDQSDMLRQEMKQLNEAVTSARMREEQARARRNELAKINAEDPQNLPATELIQSPTLQGLRASYVECVRTMGGLVGSGQGPNHPENRAAQARLDATRTALLAEVKNIQGAVERDVASLEHEEHGIKRLFGVAEGRALDVNLLEIEYNRMARAKDNNEKMYSLVLERSTESDLTRTLMFNNIRVVERPLLPRRPVSPNVPMNLGGGLLAGLVLGLAAAFGRDQLDRTMKTPDDVERVVGLSFLGLLPVHGAALKSGYSGYARERRKRRQTAATRSTVGTAELVVHEHPTSGFAEAARAIRTNILFMSPDRPYRTLLVTSAGPSEGKTTVACGIATAIAQAGRRVVLLDCDMRRPRLHRIFSIPNQTGVTTALIEASDMSTLAHPTVVPNLSIVTTGPLPPNPAELLHSEAFAKLLATLREQFDCVVIDSPPVVPVTDAAVLSTLVDGTVVVFRAFQTTKELASRAARAIHDVGGHVVGAVLNAVDMDRYEYGKGYYYYKREGYASDEGAPPSAPLS